MNTPKNIIVPGQKELRRLLTEAASLDEWVKNLYPRFVERLAGTTLAMVVDQDLHEETLGYLRQFRG